VLAPSFGFFPEATTLNPTQCLALALSEEKLQEAVDLLNNKGTKQNGLEWSVLDYNYHFMNDVAINQILQRLIFIFSLIFLLNNWLSK
jgi:hypothetical protein